MKRKGTAIQKFNSGTSVYQESENTIADILKDYLEPGELEILVPSGFIVSEFIHSDGLAGAGNQNDYTVLNSYDSSIHNLYVFKPYYETIVSYKHQIVFFDNTKSRLILFDKHRGQETESIDFSRPDGSTLNGWIVEDRFVISVSINYSVTVYVFDSHLSQVNQINVDNYMVSEIYSMNDKWFILELTGRNYNRKIYFLDSEFDFIIERSIDNSYVSSICANGNLILAQAWAKKYFVYDWKHDQMSRLVYPGFSGVKQYFSPIVRNGGKYIFFLREDNVLERYTIGVSHGKHVLQEKTIVDENVSTIRRFKSEEYIFFQNSKNGILMDSDRLSQKLLLPKEQDSIINSGCLIMQSQLTYTNSYLLYDLETENQCQVKLPARKTLRTAYGIDNSLYIAFDEDDKGIGKFNFMNGQITFNNEISRIREITVSKNDTLLAAAWGGLYELNRDLDLIRSFPKPDYVNRGCLALTYKDVVIFAGYGVKKEDVNFIIIYHYETQEVLYEFVDPFGNNTRSICCAISEEGILYFPIHKDGKKLIHGFDLNSMYYNDFIVEMIFDFRDMVIKNNHLYGASLDSKDGINYIDIVDLENGIRYPSFEIRDTREVLGLTSVDNFDKLILGTHYSSYYILNISGSTLELDTKLENPKAYMDTVCIPGFSDIVILVTHKNLVFFNLRCKKVVGELHILGEDACLVTNDKWIYSTNPDLFCVAKGSKEGLTTFLPVDDEQRVNYFRVYNSLEKVIEKLNPRFYFEQMKSQYLQNLEDIDKLPKRLTK